MALVRGRLRASALFCAVRVVREPLTVLADGQPPIEIPVDRGDRCLLAVGLFGQGSGLAMRERHRLWFALSGRRGRWARGLAACGGGGTVLRRSDTGKDDHGECDRRG